MLDDEYRYKILKELQKAPEISQRDLAKRLGVSLGKTNFCLKALIEKGLVKVDIFKNAPDKSKYLYVLTPEGIELRFKLTKIFLISKKKEYEELEKELEALKN